MKSNKSELAGVINIYKEKGYTSHDVVNVVRRCFGRIKTGHTGTLDPDAEGVLPICLGKATKLADYIQADIKQYKAVLRLGMTTTTEDTSGDVLSQKEVTATDEEIKSVIESFVGEYNQTPPMYSAIKVNGKKLYELAREGIEIERKTRLINIYAITDIKKLSAVDWEFLVLCSKGTYIRTLCRDIGEKLGCGGCMAELVRTRSGNFYIKDGVKLDVVKEYAEQNRQTELVMPVSTVLSGYEEIVIPHSLDKYLYNGNKIDLKQVSEEITADKLLVKDEDGKIIGLYSVEDGYLKPLTMLI
jgi:tRNA pseudouridine55 synthase